MKRLLCLTLLIMLFAYRLFAFDVSAYKDPRSEVRIGSQNNVTLGNCYEDYWAPGIPRYDSTDYAYWVNAVEEANREAMRLYAEMGMTNLMVYYKNEDFDLLEDIPFKVMNDLAPGHAFKYLQAQHRGVRLGVEDSLYNFGALNWGSNAIDTLTNDVLERFDQQPILRIAPWSAPILCTSCRITLTYFRRSVAETEVIVFSFPVQAACSPKSCAA